MVLIKRYLRFFIFAAVSIGCTMSEEPEPGFRFQQEKDRVDLFMENQLITSYLFADSLQKQVFYPVYSPSGFEFTRAYPLRQQAGESTDHPHHIGVWFSYGEVNGVDFWTSNWELYDGENPRFGKIAHQQVDTRLEGENAIFSSVSLWKQTKGDTLLAEKSTSWISYTDGHLLIDRFTTLVAMEDMHFEDSKEGMYAIRVAKNFEEDPDKQDAGGRYINSEGASGADVWGKQARWVILRDQSPERNASILFIDHPENPGYPAHWMARGYGLFGVNPLGKKAYTEGKDSLDLRVKKGDSVRFKYRLVLTASKEVTNEEIRNFVEGFSEE